MEEPGQCPGAGTIDLSRLEGRPVMAVRGDSIVLHPSVEQADMELAGLRSALHQAWEQIAELRRLANQDSLTGLANRRHLMAEIAVAIERLRLNGRASALILLDMNGLKALNDCFGHPTGDAAIIHVAGIVREAAPFGVAARMGGDEFALLLPDLGEAEARALAARISNRVSSSPLVCETGCHGLAVSAGVASVGRETTAASLLARADAAMYANKRGAA